MLKLRSFVPKYYDNSQLTLVKLAHELDLAKPLAFVKNQFCQETKAGRAMIADLSASVSLVAFNKTQQLGEITYLYPPCTMHVWKQ